MNRTSDNRIRRLTAVLLLCVMAFSLLTVSVSAAGTSGTVFPKPIDCIADQAAKLSESTIRQIKKTNETLLDQVGCTIAVCTVLTTGGTPIRDYAHELFLDWKLGEGVLILIAAEDDDYFIVQSTGVDAVIDNDRLKTIRDEYLEENFVAGNIDRGVLQCVTKVAQILLAEMKDAETNAAANTETETADAAPAAKKEATVGSAIVGFFKAILYIILILAVVFIAFFVFAMFNDDAAALLQKYVFQRGNQQKMPEQYYDERLYGNPNARNRSAQARPQNPQRRPQNPQAANGQRRPQQQTCQTPAGYLQNGQAAQNGQYTRNGQAAPNGQYARNGQVAQNGQYAQNNQYAQNGQYARNGQYAQNGQVRQAVRNNPYAQGNPNAQSRQPQNPAFSDDSATRAYTIPGRGQNR